MPSKIISFVKISFLPFVLIFCASAKQFPSQNYKEYNERETFRIVFYNTENLFDITDDPGVNDEDFTPDGKYHWSYTRYDLKLQHISKALIAAGEWRMPEIICLAEIENRKVMEDLIFKTPLSTGNYEIIHKESPDARGIDVGLLYNKKAFKPLNYNFIRISFPSADDKPTRDILYACGVVKSKDTVHIFVNHWPSRSGGAAESEPKRMFVASVLKHHTDSLLKINPSAKIIIVGDLNDDPDNKSLSESLSVRTDTACRPTYLYDFMDAMKKKGEGTLKYKNEWNVFDQVIVSTSLFNKTGKLYTTTADAHIFRSNYLLLTDDKYPGDKPCPYFQRAAIPGRFQRPFAGLCRFKIQVNQF